MQVHAPKYTVEELEHSGAVLRAVETGFNMDKMDTLRGLLIAQQLVDYALLQAHLTQAQEVER